MPISPHGWKEYANHTGIDSVAVAKLYLRNKRRQRREMYVGSRMRFFVYLVDRHTRDQFKAWVDGFLRDDCEK